MQHAIHFGEEFLAFKRCFNLFEVFVALNVRSGLGLSQSLGYFWFLLPQLNLHIQFRFYIIFDYLLLIFIVFFLNLFQAAISCFWTFDPSLFKTFWEILYLIKKIAVFGQWIKHLKEFSEEQSNAEARNHRNSREDLKLIFKTKHFPVIKVLLEGGI